MYLMYNNLLLYLMYNKIQQDGAARAAAGYSSSPTSFFLFSHFFCLCHVCLFSLPWSNCVTMATERPLSLLCVLLFTFLQTFATSSWDPFSSSHSAVIYTRDQRLSLRSPTLLYLEKPAEQDKSSRRGNFGTNHICPLKLWEISSLSNKTDELTMLIWLHSVPGVQPTVIL